MAPKRRGMNDAVKQIVTLKDVAAYADVSLATASRAMSGGGYVSAATKRRVQEAVRDLDYRPHAAARSLKLQRTDTIGLIITDIINPFYAQVASGVLDAAQQFGYHVILSATDEQPALEREYLDVFMEKRVDGILAVPTGRNVRAWRQARKLGIHVVLLDREVSGVTDADILLVDNYKGAYAATAHLIAFGHQRIAIIGGPTSTTTGDERLQGYCAALRDADLPIDHDMIEIDTFKKQGGIDAARRLLAHERPPTAIFASNNVLGESALAVVQDRHLTVPDDISFIMFDDVPWASLTSPKVTVIMQPTYHLGFMGVQHLVQRLRDAETTERRQVKAVLQPELIVRQSCAAPRLALST